MLLCDVLLVPVFVGVNHWTAAIIDLVEERLEYWDSMRVSELSKHAYM